MFRRPTAQEGARARWAAVVGVQLAEGTTYDWYVALVLDPNARDSDAIADLSKAIETSAPDTEAGRALRAERASLLEQVGVGAVALYEREGDHDASGRE